MKALQTLAANVLQSQEGKERDMEDQKASITLGQAAGGKAKGGCC